MTTLLTPLDFSKNATRMVDVAGNLARALNGCVVLLHVIPPVPIATDYYLEGASFGAPAFEMNSKRIPVDRQLESMNYASLTTAAEKTADRHLADYQEMLWKKSVSCRVVRLAGNPIKVILDEAAILPADYIVIGSHGHAAFYDLLVGSTTSGVIKGARCPVVVVPSADKAAAAIPSETVPAKGA